MWIILGECAKFRSSFNLLFIDFRECTLRRSSILEKLILVAIIGTTYVGARCRMLQQGKILEKFEVETRGATNVGKKIIYSESARLTLNVCFAGGKKASTFGTSQAASDAQYLGEPWI